MNFIKTTVLVFLLLPQIIVGQTKTLKEKAIQAFKEENYPKAIKLMKAASKKHPKDAEVFYYLGVFTHYNAYDSRPLAGYDVSYSETVFKYLDKALEINPGLGNARYFYTAECGAAATRALRNGKDEKFAEYLKKAYKKGGLPDWAIGYGKRLLSQVPQDAILFTHGDFIFNTLNYLQFCRSERTDVSVIPLALLNRPWYVLEVKGGGLMRNVAMNISKPQIMSMHPYKWEATRISLDVPEKLCQKYKMDAGYTMDWKVDPDLTSNRVISKIEGEKAQPRRYLSGQRAVLMSILETNKWERPVFFSKGFEKYYLAGLDAYFQDYGLVHKLLPMKTKETEWKINSEGLERLVLDGSYEDYKDVLKNDQPRASRILSTYYSPFISLAMHYKQTGSEKKVEEVIQAFRRKIMIGFRKDYEKKVLEYLKKIKE